MLRDVAIFEANGPRGHLKKQKNPFLDMHYGKWMCTDFYVWIVFRFVSGYDTDTCE